jgi:hypothetical protein
MITYQSDFYKWTQQQTALLKSKQFNQLDLDNLIEEIKSMGISEKRELISRLTILLGHLLKWKIQPEKRSNSWRATIAVQRIDLKEHLSDNPSLKHQLNERFQDSYQKGILLAVKETELHPSKFPKNPPFTLENTFDDDYFPE